MEGLWELTNALSNGTIPDPLRPPIPQDWGLQPPTKTSIAISLSQERVKLYGRQILSVHLQGPSEQNPIKSVALSIRDSDGQLFF